VNVSRLTQGLPYSAVLALLGWLMLSQGQPTADVPPQASALTRSASDACADTAPEKVEDLRVLPAVPEASVDHAPCPLEPEAERR